MRYFLNVHLGGNCIADPAGAEFPDIYAAIAEAELAAREIAADELKTGRTVSDARIEIVDTFGRVNEIVLFEHLFCTRVPNETGAQRPNLRPLWDSIATHARRTRNLVDENKLLAASIGAAYAELRERLDALDRSVSLGGDASIRSSGARSR